MDLDEFIVAVYCLVDESIEEILGGHRLRSRGPNPLLDDREVITMEVVGEFLGIDTDEGIRRFFLGHYAQWFPALVWVHRTTFARQAANLWKIKEGLWRRLALVDAPEESALLVVDSFPVPACRKARSYRCKLLWEVATHGYDELGKGFFYGVRVHLLVRWPGVVCGFKLAPANVHDLHPARSLLQENASARGWVLGDRNYHSPELAEGLAKRGLRLLTPHKVTKGERRPWPRWLVQRRRRIETVIGQLVGRYNAKKVWARDSWHLRSRFLRKILIHTVAVLLCRRAGLGPLRFSELLTA